MFETSSTADSHPLVISGESAGGSRIGLLSQALAAAIVLLLAKTFVATVLNYRFYFPADFSSDFLGGRERYFGGVYRYIFYLHIVASPIVLLAMTYLISATLLQHGRTQRIHAVIGRMIGAAVLVIVFPSGLAMSFWAAAGSVAAAGFAIQAIFTAVTITRAIQAARHRRWETHKRYILRCYVLMISPMLLRIVGGISSVLQSTEVWVYQANAWLSWVVPLIALEIWFRYGRRPSQIETVAMR